MYTKYAVWCQCVLVGKFVLSIASLLSIQNITISTDIYWSGVLLLTSVIQFIVAEHAPVAGITIDRWMQLGRIQKMTTSVIILTWSIYPWQTSWIQWAHVPVGIIAGVLLQKTWPLLVLAVIVKAMTTPLRAAPLILTVLLLAVNLQRPKVVGKSSASRQHKQTIAIKAASIFLEAVVLWLMRCEHRFPHVIRWRPLVAAAGSITVAALWCEYNVMDTIQSNDVIIVGRGHDIAASLRAAQACPVCLKHLTSLDMESSYSETNVL
tara:strand:- start:248 stop:1042 length:795 start_codon:yes stop_codon:yes gene_type:complete